MGGMFSPTANQQPVVQSGGVAPQFQPFAGQLASAIGSMFATPGTGVTPLEESTIRGSFLGAQPAATMLGNEVSGSYLPGSPNQNPFVQSGLIAPIEQQADIERRQLGASAQRAGALNSTDYLNQSRLLEGNIATQKNQVLANQYNAERGFQNNAVSTGLGLGQYLMGAAAEPRQVAQQSTLLPYQMGLQLLGPFAARNDVQGGQVQYGPSPFASMVSGLTGLASAGAPFFGNAPASTGAGGGWMGNGGWMGTTAPSNFTSGPTTNYNDMINSGMFFGMMGR